MKWTIYELKKLSRTNNKFDYVADLKQYLTDSIDDLVDIGPVYVKGSFRLQNNNAEFWFDVEVNTELTMLCAITLEEVVVPLSFQTELVFAQTMIDDSVYVIEGITIDLDPYIWGNIIVEKPMKVVSEKAYDGFKEESLPLPEEDEVSSSPFATLQKLKQK